MILFKPYFQVLKKPSFSWLILSYSFQALGYGFNYISLTWLLLNIQNSVSAIAILMICYWLPTVIFSPIAGVIIDHYNRRKIIITINFGIACILFGFSFLFHHYFSVTAIYLLTLLTSTLMSLYSANMALIRELVPKKNLIDANVMGDVTYEIGSITGFALAGLALSMWNMNSTLLFNALLFTLAAISAMMIKQADNLCYKTIKKPQKLFYKKFFTDYKDGLNYIKNEKGLFSIYIVQLIVMINFMTAPILLAPFSKNIFHASASQFGYLEASLSIGAIIGSLLSPFFARMLGLKKVLYIEICMLGILFLIFSNVTTINYAMIIYFLIGMCLTVWPLIITRAQELTSIDYQGRVQSTFNGIAGGIILLFYLMINFVSQHVSINKVYWLETAIDMLALLLIWSSIKIKSSE